jgi:hypothetical protein
MKWLMTDLIHTAVAVVYTGVVEETNSDGEVLVSVMHKCRGGWQWPTPKDVIWYLRTSIVKMIGSPVPINTRGLFTFHEQFAKETNSLQ